MLAKETIHKLTALAAQVAEKEGCILYDLEFVGGSQGRVLRVFIDKPSTGVMIEDCANVSRSLNDLVEIDEELIPGRYHLEVSSPGLERSLRLPWHFSRVIGKRVRFKLNKSLQDLGNSTESMGSAKQLNAKIISIIDDQSLLLETADQQQVHVPLENVEKAHVIFEPEVTGKKKGKG